MDVVKQKAWRAATTGEAAAETARLLRRLSLQLDFATGFCALAGHSKEKVDACKTKAQRADPTIGLDGLRALVASIEAELADLGRAAKAYTIHCVGHGHIDMNWMWSWPETVSTTHDTFASVLDLMDKVPGFTYSQSQASVYAAMEKYHPAQFEQIKQRVKEGRWEVAASHWVEGDKNLASGESLCRHLLYTRRYFQKKFDLSPADVPVDWEPDTFGYASTIPMFNAAGGVKYAYSCRPGGGWEHPRVGEPRPPVFWWKAPDGSRVLVFRETTWYNSYVNIGDDISAPMLSAVQATPGLRDWLNVYGVGNHGGGPTRAEVDYLAELAIWPVYPNVVFSTAKRYFETVAAAGLDLPEIDHELNYEFTGCYTSQSLIKQANRLGENYCVEAETLALLAGLDRRDTLRDAWVNVLFNQFHDILPGSGVRETREHARAIFQETAAVTGAVKRDALSAIANEVDTASLVPGVSPVVEESALAGGAGQGAGLSGYSRASGGGKSHRAFIVYNPCGWTRSEPVTVTLYDTEFDENSVVAWDETGLAHPTQSLGKGHDWGHEKLTLLFMAREIPAFGYRTYVFGEGVVTAQNPMVTALNGETFTTPHLHTRFEKSSGAASLWEGGPALGQWRHELEAPTMMSGWILGEPRATTPMHCVEHRTRGHLYNAATALVQNPDALASIASWHLKSDAARASSVKLKATVHPLSPRLDFDADIDWREIGRPEVGVPGLSVWFGGLEFDEFLCEAPFGVTSRPPTPGDVPALRFVHGFDHKAGRGITLLQDSKYGFQLRPDGIGMRVVRSSYDPDPTPEVAVTTLRYAVVVHDTPPSKADLIRLGASWNHPLLLAPTGIHPGPQPTQHGFATVEQPNVVITCLKAPEDGAGIVVRLVETDGVPTKATVTLDPELVPPGALAATTDLLESPESSEVQISEGRLEVEVPAYGMRTVVVRPG